MVLPEAYFFSYLQGFVMYIDFFRWIQHAIGGDEICLFDHFEYNPFGSEMELILYFLFHTMSTSTKLLQITLRWLSLKPENFRKYKGKPLGLSVNHSRKILLLTVCICA